MFVIVGLGNPGSKYEETRHNVGFMLVDAIAKESGVSSFSTRFGCLTARTSWHGYDVFLAKPQSYMNLSGTCVQQIVSFFKIPDSFLFVVFDDLDQSHGAVKTRLGGSHGGHNGMRNILELLPSDKFHRIKIGIGKPLFKGATADWVLSKFTGTEFEQIEKESFPIAKKRILDLMKQEQKKS